MGLEEISIILLIIGVIVYFIVKKKYGKKRLGVMLSEINSKRIYDIYFDIIILLYST